MFNLKALGVAALACALAVPAVANAQGAPAATNPPAAPAAHAKGQKAGHNGLAKLVTELNLTPEQQAKLRPIVKDQRAKAKALREDKALTPADRKAKMQTLHQETMKQIMAVLTPEQQAKLKSLAHNGKHAAKKGKKGANATPNAPASNGATAKP